MKSLSQSTLGERREGNMAKRPDGQTANDVGHLAVSVLAFMPGTNFKGHTHPGKTLVHVDRPPDDLAVLAVLQLSVEFWSV